jgi:molybdate transport system substrate-binding protein
LRRRRRKGLIAVRCRILLAAALCAFAMIGSPKAEQLHVLAAGSLREVLGELGKQYQKATGVEVTADFGPSGILRRRIEQGEGADLFASADVGHPQALLNEGFATRVVMFTRNKLCGIAAPKLGLTTANFIDRLLDPAVRLGTSTPKADPAGDYTWAMFHKIEAQHPGSYAILDKKAQQIVGGPTNNAPVGGKDPAALALATGRVDLFIGYCSGGKRLLAQLAKLQIVPVPQTIATGPEYGLAVLKGADPHTDDFALYMLSPTGQQIFADYGFAPVALPTPGR